MSKILSFLVIALSALLFFNVQQIKQKDIQIKLLADANTELKAKADNFAVNIKSVVEINAKLNATVAEQNLAIKAGADLVAKLEKKQRENKIHIKKLQNMGKTFAVKNNSRSDSAEENIAYLLAAVPHLLEFNPAVNLDFLE